MAHDAFISYSSKDKTVGDAVCATLEGAGIRCWIAPRDISPGTDWGAAIITGIEGARVFVLVFSRHANDSQQVKREVERAVHKGIAIIPLRIEDVVPAASLEYFLSTPHWLDAFTPPLDRHLQYLAAVVRQIIEGAPAVPLPPPKPRPRYLRRAVIGGGIAAAACAGAAAWYEWRPVAPPSFVGKWQAAKLNIDVVQGPNNTNPLADLFTAAFSSPSASATFEVTDIGQYAFSIAGEDHGTVALAPGRQPPSAMLAGYCRGDNVKCGALTFTSAFAHKAITCGYMTSAYKSDNGTIDGGKPGEYTLMIASQNWWANFYGASPDSVAGHWHNQTLIWRDLYDLTLDITAVGAYRLRLSRAEHGLFQAAAGKWTQTPSGGPPATGSYEFSGPNHVTQVSSRSSIQWQRRL